MEMSDVQGKLLFWAIVGSFMVTRYAVNKNKEEIEELKKKLEKEKSLRSEERRGRIKLQQSQRDRVQEKVNEEGYSMKPIGVIRSQYPDRRGTPRQPNLVRSSRGKIEFDRSIIQQEHFQELGQFSHLWVVWVFHKNTNIDSNKKTVPAKIQPPRLCGARVGCLSTRSPHRPNPIGLSVVEVVSIGKSCINIKLVDMVDGTPVLDVKPYLPHDTVPLDESLKLSKADIFTGLSTTRTALCVPSWIYEAEITMRNVILSDAVERSLSSMEDCKQFHHCTGKANAVSLIQEVLQQDIRSHHQGRGSDNLREQIYECKLDSFTIKFRTFEDYVLVEEIQY